MSVGVGVGMVHTDIRGHRRLCASSLAFHLRLWRICQWTRGFYFLSWTGSQLTPAIHLLSPFPLDLGLGIHTLHGLLCGPLGLEFCSHCCTANTLNWKALSLASCFTFKEIMHRCFHTNSFFLLPQDVSYLSTGCVHPGITMVESQLKHHKLT